MIKNSITAFIAVFLMSAALSVSPALSDKEQFEMQRNYTTRQMQQKAYQADLEVKRLADAYARMSDSERMKGDAELE
ncbi:hypothetical protein BHC47_06760 [Snodgrassella alvi]|uniref:Uncharacterized protein n=1 Tax=Snodgrassella alvi TaxID=1196083 RepID=A0A2N9Y2U8_9NEIS|nr:hypothetical protein [Snodgrassella alvi]PIT61540.1 hypothetical protein BHC47_06760 [Snodgrassella alvi]PIT67089.1 hypothetical protein BHC56_09325 [Snodgrassella alvi]